jgi:hypothetical protein
MHAPAPPSTCLSIHDTSQKRPTQSLAPIPHVPPQDGAQAGSERAVLHRVARALLRLALASYQEARAVRQRGTGEGSAEPLGQPSDAPSRIWRRRELQGVSASPIYDPMGAPAPKLQPPQVLTLGLGALRELLRERARAGPGDGARAAAGGCGGGVAGASAGMAGERAQLAGMLPLLVRLAAALEEEVDAESPSARCVAASLAA